MTQHVPPDYRQMFHMRAKLARLRIETLALERQKERTETVNKIRVVVQQAPVAPPPPVKAVPVLRYDWPIGPLPDGRPMVVLKTISAIQQEVSQQFGFSLIDLVSERRNAALVLARHFAMWRCKRETTNSLVKIARRFGDRDHTTCLSAIRRIDRLIAEGKLTEQGLVP